MEKLIQFLEANKHILELLKAGKVSLVGVNQLETQAIVGAFDEELLGKTGFWS